MDDEKSRKRVGAFILYSLFIIADMDFVWHVNRSFALAYAVLGLLGILLDDGALSSKTIFYVVSFFLIGSVAVLPFIPPILPDETETHGWLLPAHEPMPVNGCRQVKEPENSILFVAGTNGVLTNFAGKKIILDIGSSTQLSVERDGQRLLFDADIHDGDGKLVARIVRNEFHLISGKFSYRDRSDDRSKIAVYDNDGNEMLFVDYVNTTTVLLRGYFTSPDRTRIKIDDKQITILDVNNVLSGNCKVDSSPNPAMVLSRESVML